MVTNDNLISMEHLKPPANQEKRPREFIVCCLDGPETLSPTVKKT